MARLIDVTTARVSILLWYGKRLLLTAIALGKEAAASIAAKMSSREFARSS